ncbi:MAG: hypothetical protein RR280_10295, partial [Bacteroidaceae bacterium]
LLRASPRKDDTQKQTGDTAKLLRDDIRRTQDNEEKDLNKRSLCVLLSIFIHFFFNSVFYGIALGGCRKIVLTLSALNRKS